METLHRRVGGRVVQTIPQIGVLVVLVHAGGVPGAVSVYASDPATEFAEPDSVAQAFVIPDDPYFGSQWGLYKVEAPAAWDSTTGSNTIRIAVLDTGISTSHPDLAGKVVSSRNFTDDPTADDNNGHGTHVAGIASAVTNNAVGIAGTDWNARLMNGKVLNQSGSGYYSWIASGITWAADNGAQVINLSLGGNSPSSTLQAAVDYAWSRGVLLACAAGNDGLTTPSYPAYYANCIAVGATTQSDSRASFSNYGTWVDVGAPGVGILSTVPGGYASWSGTPMATPHVAGLAGLLRTRQATNTAVRACIENNTDPVSGAPFARGRINARRAVECAGGTPPSRGGPTPTPSPTPFPSPSPSPSPTPSPTPTPKWRR
jgi:thermitase